MQKITNIPESYLYLRDILDESNSQLDIGEVVQVGQPGDFMSQGYN